MKLNKNIFPLSVPPCSITTLSESTNKYRVSVAPLEHCDGVDYTEQKRSLNFMEEIIVNLIGMKN